MIHRNNSEMYFVQYVQSPSGHMDDADDFIYGTFMYSNPPHLPERYDMYGICVKCMVFVSDSIQCIIYK